MFILINYLTPQDGLAIVRVTVLSSPVKVFLTTLCLAPIPYENVQKGVKPKQYLEIDPKFARELDIHFGIDVSWNSGLTRIKQFFPIGKPGSRYLVCIF